MCLYQPNTSEYLLSTQNHTLLFCWINDVSAETLIMRRTISSSLHFSNLLNGI